MKMYMVIGVLILIIVAVVGVWYKYSREYYRPSGLSNISIRQNNGVTTIHFNEMPESLYYASGAQIMDENDNEIIVSIVRENIRLGRDAQFPVRGDFKSGHFVEIPNPKNKTFIIK